MTLDDHSATKDRKTRHRAEQDAAFERYRKGLQRELMRLSSFTDLYRRLNELQSIHGDTMVVAPAFFGTVATEIRISPKNYLIDVSTDDASRFAGYR